MSNQPIDLHAAGIADMVIPTGRIIPATTGRDYLWHVARDTALAALRIACPDGVEAREDALLHISSAQRGMFDTVEEWGQYLQEQALDVVSPGFLAQPCCGQCGSSNVMTGNLTLMGVSGSVPATLWKCNACVWEYVSDDAEQARRVFERGSPDMPVELSGDGDAV